MRSWTRWLYLIAGVAVAFVGVSSIVLAVRRGSWAPILSVGWFPAVVVSTRPGAYRRCLLRRAGRSG
jgi:hypothetical protein